MNYSEGTPERAKELYEVILHTANKFLSSAKRFEISALQDFNPSFEELAGIMKAIAPVIRGLADEVDPTLGNKALDYAEIMSRMALAISSKDHILLEQNVKILESRPFV